MNCPVLTRIYRSKNSEVCYYVNDDSSHLRNSLLGCGSIVFILINCQLLTNICFGLNHITEN